MKLAHAAVVGSCVFGLAVSVQAKPENYRYDRCTHRYTEGLGKRHRDLHREAVDRDEANHVKHRGDKKKLQAAHARIQAYLDRAHRDLAERDAKLRSGHTPPSPPPTGARDHSKVTPPAPPPKPLDDGPGLRKGHEKDNPGRHLGHDKEHPGKHKGNDKEPPGQAKKKDK